MASSTATCGASPVVASKSARSAAKRSSSALVVRCQQGGQQQANNSRRSALALQLGSVMAAGLAMANAPAARATGLESVELPSVALPESVAGAIEDRARANAARLAEAEEKFQNSDLLATLKARSEENKDQRRRELQDKYCFRQAELGVGDCAGLRLIPGMTKSGVQKRPELLNKIFGLESQE